MMCGFDPSGGRPQCEGGQSLQQATGSGSGCEKSKPNLLHEEL